MPNLCPRITETEWELFLRELERSSSRSAAAKAAGLRYSAVAARMDRDPYFKAAVLDSEAVALGRCEETLHKLANGDIDEPVFHQGVIVGYKRIYSERAAMFLLERRDPRYSPKQHIEMSQTEPLRSKAEKDAEILTIIKGAMARRSAETIDVVAREVQPQESFDDIG